MVSYYNSQNYTRASKVKDKMAMKLLNVMIMVSIIVQIVVLANNSSFSSLSPYHPPYRAPFLLPLHFGPNRHKMMRKIRRKIPKLKILTLYQSWQEKYENYAVGSAKRNLKELSSTCPLVFIIVLINALMKKCAQNI